ncbi:DUF4278 domain-containing protein [Leptolyngbya sp. CCY15150]|uniref:DUF4278 domain-containing protein n=1 Tax=Leptolyngbya sp. CCY15150 TaxID=2767772 RepID=UPI00194E339F|nr:DUF4278 domain-containing protein [Leptolyngbya sp. CCY15150]
MQLSYRGVTYDYTPPQVNYNSKEAVGKYRGLDIRFRKVSQPVVQLPTLDLIYRGAHTLHHA